MTFPSVLSVTEKTLASTDTAGVMTFPGSVNDGDLLLFLGGVDFGGGAPSAPSGTGWTASLAWNDLGGVNITYMGLYAKVGATGDSSATFTVPTGAGAAKAGQIWQIAGWGGTIATHLARSSLATGASTTPDPGIATGTGTGDNLFLWFGEAGDDGNTVQTWEANFTDNRHNTVANSGANASCEIFISSRNYNAAASLNPGSITLNGSERWGALTIVIAPGSSGGASAVTIAVSKGAVAAAGKTVTINSQTLLAIVKGAVVIAGKTITPQTLLTLAKGAVAAAGKTVTINSQTLVSVAKGAVAFGGKTVSALVTGAFARYFMLMRRRRRM